MGKLAQSTSKYTVYAKFEADGTVEKPDVIGAVFGQTEGLLGPDMDLRELQRTGRIGRIEVNISMKNGKASGTILIPSSLDSSETALIAACCETIERIGPCNAAVVVEKIEDVRAEKRRYVIERAKELLSRLFEYGEEAQEISDQIKEAVRSSEISSFRGLPSGPGLDTYDSLIIVEGRADVINLLRCGIKNCIAIEGTSIPESIVELSKQKITTVFLDGDRGGDLILKELLAVTEVDFVARAPRGKEVEELSKKEVFKILRSQVPLDQYKEEFIQEEKFIPKPKEVFLARLDNEKKERFKTILNELTGTRAAYFLDENMSILGKVPAKEMFNTMKELRADALVFDGEIDQKLVTFSAQRGVRYIAGMKYRGRVSVPESMQVFAAQDLQ